SPLVADGQSLDGKLVCREKLVELLQRPGKCRLAEIDFDHAGSQVPRLRAQLHHAVRVAVRDECSCQGAVVQIAGRPELRIEAGAELLRATEEVVISVDRRTEEIVLSRFRLPGLEHPGSVKFVAMQITQFSERKEQIPSFVGASPSV